MCVLFRSDSILFSSVQSVLLIHGFCIHEFNQPWIINIVYLQGWLIPWKWKPRIRRADYETWASADFGICGRSWSQSPMNTKGILYKNHIFCKSSIIHEFSHGFFSKHYCILNSYICMDPLMGFLFLSLHI